MRTALGRLVFLAFLCVSSVSCGGDAPAVNLYPVSGKITYLGAPAAGAVISLQPESAPPLTKQGNPIVPMAVAGEDGSFSIACEGFGSGVPSGKYKVLVTWRPTAGVPAAKPLLAKKKKSGNYDPKALMPADVFNGRYSNPGKPLLTAEIQPGPNELLFELKD